MNVNKPASAHTLKSDLKRVDSHKPKASEYSELPELTDAMLARGAVKRGGRPVAAEVRGRAGGEDRPADRFLPRNDQ